MTKTISAVLIFALMVGIIAAYNTPAKIFAQTAKKNDALEKMIMSAGKSGNATMLAAAAQKFSVYMLVCPPNPTDLEKQCDVVKLH